MRFSAFGHSHIVSVAKGAYELQRSPEDSSIPAFLGDFHYLFDEAYIPTVTVDASGLRLHPRLQEMLSGPGLQFVLLSISGNEHNVLSMQKQRAFDFVLGENLTLPLSFDAEIVPEAAVRETLRERMTGLFDVLDAFGSATRLPIGVLSPPPPLPRHRVLANSKEFFRNAIDAKRLAPPSLRHKIWRVQLGLYREICDRLGFVFYEVPAELVDAEGMLIEAACGQDATHANELFGQKMIATVLASPPTSHRESARAEDRGGAAFAHQMR